MKARQTPEPLDGELRLRCLFLGISLHGEDGRVILTKEGGERSEVDLRLTGKRAETPEVQDDDGKA